MGLSSCGPNTLARVAVPGVLARSGPSAVLWESVGRRAGEAWGRMWGAGWAGHSSPEAGSGARPPPLTGSSIVESQCPAGSPTGYCWVQAATVPSCTVSGASVLTLDPQRPPGNCLGCLWCPSPRVDAVAGRAPSSERLLSQSGTLPSGLLSCAFLADLHAGVLFEGSRSLHECRVLSGLPRLSWGPHRHHLTGPWC